MPKHLPPAQLRNLVVAITLHREGVVRHATNPRKGRSADLASPSGRGLALRYSMTDKHDATSSMLGYIFQSRYALHQALHRLRTGEPFSVAIETLEDVVFHQADGTSAAELLQTKHHLDSKAGLTDASEDLWKTVRIWAEGVTQKRWTDDMVFYLLTTGQAKQGTIGAYLKHEGRDIEKARCRLDTVAQSSTSATNRPYYDAYLALSKDDKEELLGRVWVVDSVPDIVGVETKLKESLALSVEKNYVQDLVTRLEGWWFQRVVRHLTTKNKPAILSEELQAELDRLRDQYRSDNLPVDDLILQKSIDSQAFSSHVFVEQLRVIDISERRLLAAMREYFRAFEHRSRWLRDGFLFAGDLERYDNKLVEEWETHFDGIHDELEDGAAEDKMRSSARKLYGWAEREAEVILRAGCREPFVTRGSLQMLADKVKIGWHPEFLKRFGQAMGGSSGP